MAPSPQPRQAVLIPVRPALARPPHLFIANCQCVLQSDWRGCLQWPDSWPRSPLRHLMLRRARRHEPAGKFVVLLSGAAPVRARVYAVAMAGILVSTSAPLRASTASPSMNHSRHLSGSPS